VKSDAFEIKNGQAHRISQEAFGRMIVRHLINGPYVVRVHVMPDQESIDGGNKFLYFTGNDYAYKYAVDNKKNPKFLDGLFDRIQRRCGGHVLGMTIDQAFGINDVFEVFPDAKMIKK